MKLTSCLIGVLVLATASVARAQTDPNVTPPTAAAPAPAPATPAPAPASLPAPTPAATEAPSFGAAGQLVVTGEASVSSMYESFSMGGGHITTFDLAPSIDYFVIPNLSIGGALGFSTTSFSPSGGGQSSTDTSIAILARVGYNIPMGPVVSFWPQLEIGYAHTSDGVSGQTTSGHSVPLAINAPFLFHVAPHFFLGIGPTFETELSAKDESQGTSKVTAFGVQSVVGGYFGGP
ncbi:MAG TPA: hypothetical protein VK989_04365 [Polyangia bacterium]|jgi:hypothetical protein|nr:hypothetical protein [Polyangia bacterium]